MTINAMTAATQVAGSQTALAKKLGCTPQNVQWMCATGKPPAKHVLRIESLTGVSRHMLRPDLYPEESSTSMPTKILAYSHPSQTHESAVNSSSTAQASV